MPKFEISDTAYVPTALLGIDGYHTLTARSVLAVNDRSVTVDTIDRATTTVASARAHRAPLGFLTINIGDFSTATDLQLLAESISTYFRLLLPDDHLKRVDLRTLAEMKQFWTIEHTGVSHVVLAGHASRDGFPFLDCPSPVTGKQLAQALTALSVGTENRQRHFLSLGCETGRQSVGGEISDAPICGDFVGPFKPVHSASAAHFCQTYFASLLLEGRVAKAAFDNARRAVRGETKFRLWRNGELVAGA